jgi:DNA excision repair protein ERCC-6
MADDDDDWAEAEAAWAAAEAEADAAGAAELKATAASTAAAAAQPSAAAAQPAASARPAAAQPAEQRAGAAAAAATAAQPSAEQSSFQIQSAGLSSTLTSFSSDTADMLSNLGVRGASADALESNIMEQVNAAAKKAEIEAAKKRRARERHAAAGGNKKVRREGLTESRERRRQEEAQGGAARGGRGTAGASGGAKRPQKPGAGSSEDSIRKKHRDERVKALRREGEALKTHIKQLGVDLVKLEKASKRSKLHKAQRLLAARKSKLTAVESEIKVLELLSQPVSQPIRSGAVAAGSGSGAALARVAAGGSDPTGETERERMIRMGQITPFQNVEGLERRAVDPTRMPTANRQVLEQTLRSTAMTRARAANRHGRAEAAARGAKTGQEAGFQAQLAANRPAIGSRSKSKPKVGAIPKKEKVKATPAPTAHIFQEGAGASAQAAPRPQQQQKKKRPSTGDKRPATTGAKRPKIAGKRPPSNLQQRSDPGWSDESSSDDDDRRSDGTGSAAAAAAGSSAAAGAAAGGGSESDLELARRLQAEEEEAAGRGRHSGRERRRSTAPARSTLAAAAASSANDEDDSDLFGNISADEEEESEKEEDGEDLFSTEDEEDEDEDDDLSEGEAEPDLVDDVDDSDEPAALIGGGGNRRGKQKKKKKKQRNRRGSGEVSDASGGGGGGGGDPDEKDTWTSLTNAQQDALQATDSDDVVFDGNLRVPGNIYDNLLDYQQVGLKWLWELHSQRAGGIVGDEMGLGKTIQLISLLGSLGNSGLLQAPSIIVAPATLLQQWAREFSTWAPRIPVAVYHDSGMGSSVEALDDVITAVTQVAAGADGDSDEEFAARPLWCHGVVITTYEQIRTKLEALLQHSWHYLILDEGHKIRNPDTGITLAVKQFDTPHRLILSGSPIQNSLTELWSLFDFVLPGKLGTLPVFKEQFELPITIGGYANASTMQVETAYRCSVVLKGLIGPYLLRRLKRDVGTSLPDKTEQVLFCELTREQRTAYLDFLGTDEMRSTLAGKRKPFAAITELRKICNHPDLLDRLAAHRPADYGSIERSGKLVVAEQILTMWATQGHRALVFSQTRQMLDILEFAVQGKPGMSYRRMDGELPIKQRLAMIDEYNSDRSIFVFLLTTKVGGLGVNLTGADRVLLFDPDWNPSTDMQARERAWRLGQTRPVTVYRLLTAGTIEEKMYHRQIFKQMLTDKVLKDPMQKRFFKAGWLQDLFTLSDSAGGMGTSKGGDRRRLGGNRGGGGLTETHSMFQEAHVDRPDGQGQPQGAAAAAAPGAAAARPRSAYADVSDEDDVGGSDVPAGVRIEDMPVADEGDGGDGGGGNADGTASSQHKSDNATVLKSLFDGGDGEDGLRGVGVKGAVSHDRIMEQEAVDKVIVRQKAEQIAQQAIAGLKASSHQRQRSSITTPTWTGRKGEAGMPRQQVNVNVGRQRGSSGHSGGGGGGGSDRSMPELRMGKELVEFLKGEGGSAPSNSIIAHFQRGVTVAKVGSEVRSAREMELFRQLLKQMARLNKQTKEWRLKES